MPVIGPEQLGRFFDEHARALTLYARQWSDAPEDVVQDAFVSLARQWSVPDRVVPWLYRVVRNAARRYQAGLARLQKRLEPS
jgi:DNA-directed RNA polymerase specialized sigma24 family protein